MSENGKPPSRETSFWGGEGKAADAAMWEMSLWGEAGPAMHCHSLVATIDIWKCYEQVDHFVLLDSARDLNSPPRLLSMAIILYRMCRVIQVEGAFTDKFNCTSTIVAGCSMATALLQALAVRVGDAHCKLWPNIRLKVVVDDMTLQAIATRSRILRWFIPALVHFVQFLENQLLLPVALDKGHILGS